MSGGQDEQTTTSESNQTSSNQYSSSTLYDLPPWFRDAMIGAGMEVGGAYQSYQDAIADYSPAGFTPDQVQAQDMGRELATDPNSSLYSPIDYYQSVLDGDYLYGGDAFNAAVDAANREVLPYLYSQWGMGNRDGGLAGVAIADAVSDNFAKQYLAERGFQQDAATRMQNAALMPTSVLEQIGLMQQQQAEREAMAPVQMGGLSFEATRNLMSTALPLVDVFGTRTTEGMSEGTTNVAGSQTQPVYEGSPIAGAAGGALTGFSVAGPPGAVVGGVAGLLS